MAGNVDLQGRINTEREAAATAFAAAEAMRADIGTEAWTAEREAAFDAAIADFGQHNAEADRLQGQLRRLQSLDEHLARINETVATTRHAAPARTAETNEFERVHAELFNAFLRDGEHVFRSAAYNALTPDEQHGLFTTTGELGGFLATPTFAAELIRHQGEMQVMRGLVRVVPTDGDSLQWIKVNAGSTYGNTARPSGVTGTMRQEGYVSGGTAPTVQNQPRFGVEDIPMHIWQPDAIEIGPKLMRNKRVNLDSLIAELLGETKAIDEDQQIITGSGVGEPEGIINSTTIGTVKSGTANALTYGGLVDLYTALPSAYRQNSTFLMNGSTTYAQLLKLTDTEGHLIIPANSNATQLWTRPIVFSEYMEAGNSDGKKAIAYGDFRRAYVLADGESFRIQRLVERYAPNVGFLAYSLYGGQVVQPLAMKLQVVGA
jgi:HK97 family phage major capsid protein